MRQRNSRQPSTDGFWYHKGDLARLLGIKRTATVGSQLQRLRDRGYTLKRRRAPFHTVQTTGWGYEYRLWEAS